LSENFPASNDLVIVDFYADWCEPCKWALPVIEEVLTHFKGKIALEKVNIDEQPELAASLHIMSVPTFILYKNRKEIWRMRGFDIAPVMIRKIEAVVEPKI
jgi:thioredoxin 1